MAAKEKVNLSFADEKVKLSKFFSEFESADDFSDALHGRNYYLAQLQQISDRTKSILEVFVEDLESYLVANDDSSLFSNILNNTKNTLIFTKLIGNIKALFKYSK